jgi:hypothetical protein
MVKRLQNASPMFCEFWDEHDVAATENVIKRLLHPEIGLLRLKATTLWLNQGVGGRLVVYTPADEATQSAHLLLAEVRPRPLFDVSADPAA